MEILRKYLFVILIMFASTGFALIGVQKNGDAQGFTEITVSHGDSLWKLAAEMAGEKKADKWIREVVAMNELKSMEIRSGERLKVPSLQTGWQESGKLQLAGEGK